MMYKQLLLIGGLVLSMSGLMAADAPAENLQIGRLFCAFKDLATTKSMDMNHTMELFNVAHAELIGYQSCVVTAFLCGISEAREDERGGAIDRFYRDGFGIGVSGSMYDKCFEALWGIRDELRRISSAEEFMDSESVAHEKIAYALRAVGYTGDSVFKVRSK